MWKREDGRTGTKARYLGTRPLQPHIISPPSSYPSPPKCWQVCSSCSVASKFHLHSRPKLACEPTSQRATRATAPAGCTCKLLRQFDLTTARRTSRQTDCQPASQPASCSAYYCLRAWVLPSCPPPPPASSYIRPHLISISISVTRLPFLHPTSLPPFLFPPLLLLLPSPPILVTKQSRGQTLTHGNINNHHRAHRRKQPPVAPLVTD